jgi:hypothetical protein
MIRMIRALVLAWPMAAIGCMIPAQQPQGTTYGYGAQAQAQGGVHINGNLISPDQIRQLGGNPDAIPAGNYWYDGVSGLFGTVGGGAQGVTSPGLPFGPMPAGVSGSGMTGIFINGREITMQEAQYLTGIVGGQIPQGRYFLQANGNAGQEGGPVAINLYAAAKAHGGGRGGGGGGGGGQATYIGTDGGGGYYDPSTGDSYFSFHDSSGKEYSTEGGTYDPNADSSSDYDSSYDSE